ncbi:MAG TPA: BadF/BadG/BcrA/BcrD ATPase family protein, partial [Arenibaculum sp.]|nr:BadF/BadG/BcrA/BcrD ATPase family protein [Arenibaculum sp.]
MGEQYFIGVDGGGTTCRARVCDTSGRPLGEGVAGPANPRIGIDAAHAEILKACDAALRDAGIPRAAFRRIHAGLGLAGVGQPRERDLVLARPYPFAGVSVDTDAYAACLGAHGGRDGAIVSVGTGTASLALVGGRRTVAGGWGFEVSDDGSGAFLGREAVRRSLWAHDGTAASTPLARAVMDRFAHRPEDVVAWVGSARPRDYAALAPLVLEHAALCDPLALDVVGEAAGHVSRLVARMFAAGAPAVCLLGGLAAPLGKWLPPSLRDRLRAPE